MGSILWSAVCASYLEGWQEWDTCNQLVVGGFAGPSWASSFETILLRALFPASVPELSKIPWKGLKWQLPGTFLPAFRCCIQGEAKYHSGWAMEEVENLQHVWLSVMPPGHHGSGSWGSLNVCVDGLVETMYSSKNIRVYLHHHTGIAEFGLVMSTFYEVIGGIRWTGWREF